MKFPKFPNPVRAKWAPIYIEPNPDAYERLVAGVIAVEGGRHHVQFANGLGKLECLYGEKAEALLYALEVAELHFQSLSMRDLVSDDFSDLPMQGMKIGEFREGEGATLESIAISWLKGISSLQMDDEASVLLDAEYPMRAPSALSPQSAGTGIEADVMRFVIEQRSGLKPFFANRLQGKKSARKSYETRIDFAGSKLVANFGALKPTSVGHSANAIKRKLWDLAIERNNEPPNLSSRLHELLVAIPTFGPNIGADDLLRARDAFSDLERQADTEELRLRRMGSPEKIAERILEIEAA